METNIKGIYAAGDVCHANWKSSNHWLQMRLWTQARQMGMFAAQCMYTSLQSHGVEKKDLDFCFEMLFSKISRTMELVHYCLSKQPFRQSH